MSDERVLPPSTTTNYNTGSQARGVCNALNRVQEGRTAPPPRPSRPVSLWDDDVPDNTVLNEEPDALVTPPVRRAPTTGSSMAAMALRNMGNR